MRDATRQRAYSGKRKWLYEGLDSDNPKDSRVEAYKDLKKHIDKILSGSYVNADAEKYDRDFLTLASKICSSVNADKHKHNSKGFSFGNAQKLINMTIKYFYIMTYRDESKRELFKNCHCPMDGNMLRIVYDKEKEYINLQGFNEYTFVEKGWGAMDFENGSIPKRYECFQNCVRKQISTELNSIEYDFNKW